MKSLQKNKQKKVWKTASDSFDNTLHDSTVDYTECEREKILCQWMGWSTYICYIWRDKHGIQLSSL